MPLHKNCYLSSLNSLRKIAAILFMLVFAFNLCGYRFVISILQTKADARLEAQIDNSEYDESQLIEMQVPLNMAYQTRYTEFERHYGEITIDGKAYTYVKRKIAGDVLILKCIANESKQELRSTEDGIVKSNSGQDQDNNTGKKQTTSLKGFSGDYDDKNQFCDLSATIVLNQCFTARYNASLNDVLIQTPHQPPKTTVSIS
jgi:hypothetical protein